MKSILFEQIKKGGHRCSRCYNGDPPARMTTPLFPARVFEMLADSANHHLIKWCDSGDAFTIIDEDRLAETILPKYFSHCQFSSFARQLLAYDFCKSVTEDDCVVYKHKDDLFRQDKPELLDCIKRHKQVRKRGRPRMSGQTFNYGNDAAAHAHAHTSEALAYAYRIIATQAEQIKALKEIRTGLEKNLRAKQAEIDALFCYEVPPAPMAVSMPQFDVLLAADESQTASTSDADSRHDTPLRALNHQQELDEPFTMDSDICYCCCELHDSLPDFLMNN